jgi:hypothetical protein
LAVLRWPRWPTFAPHEAAAPAPNGMGAAAIQLLLLAALWIAAHPYRGIIHDARLYAVQALHALDPGRFDQDLYFQYGSQDAFTLFTAAYKPLVAAVGLSTAHMAATAAGQALWFIALLVLMRTLFGAGREGLVATVAAILLAPAYGGLSVFRYAEPFATPRLFAEALVLASLAFALRGRMILAGAGIIAAAALHPIMALAGATVVATYAALCDRRVWILIGLGAVASLGLAFARVAPLDRLLLRFDDAWFSVVEARSAFGFLTRWDWTDGLRLAGLAAMLAVAWRAGRPAERRLVAALALASMAALGVSVVGGELGRDIFIVDVQPWRVLWITTLMANALAAVTALRLPPKGAARWLTLAALLLSAAASFFWEGFPLYPALFILAAGTYAWEVRRGPVTARSARYALAAAVIIALSLAAYVLAVQVRPSLDVLKWTLRVAVAASAAGVILARPPVRPGACSALTASLLCIAAVLLVDARSSWGRFVETGSAPPDLAAFVGDAPHLYWEDGAALVWLKLRRPSYYSCVQGSGAMFYAGTAREYQRRSAALSVLNTLDFADQPGEICPLRADPGRRGPSSWRALASACRTLPELDAVVLDHPVAGVLAQTWRAPAPRDPERPLDWGPGVDTYYKIACARFR